MALVQIPTPTSGTNWALVNAGGTSLSNSTVTISGITKDNLMIYVVDGSTTSTGQASIQFRFNADSGSLYSYAGLQLRGTSPYVGAGGAATINMVGNNINSQTKIEVLTMTNDAIDTFNGFMIVKGASGSIKTHNSSFASSYNSGSNGPRPQVSGGLYTGTSAVTSVSIITSAGTFDAGTIYVYEGQ